MPTPWPDEVALNKAAIVERCLRRMGEEFLANPALDNFTHIDAMTLNIERACQAAIDLAMHIVASDHLGSPQSSADAFQLLTRAGRLPAEVARAMAAMTGFRNVAIHQYQEMDLAVLRTIAQTRHRDFVAFCAALGLRIAP